MAWIFQWTSIVLGFVAALLWIRSALVKFPTQFQIDAYNIGEVSIGQSDQLNELGRKIASQSRFSAWAAFLTGTSLIAQAFAVVLSVNHPN